MDLLVVQGAVAVDETDTPETRRLLTALLAELPMGRAVALAAQVTGLKRKALYELALRLAGRQPEAP